MIIWIFVAVLLIFLMVQMSRRPKGFPPGPRGFPILGYAPLFYRKHKLTYKVSEELHEKYGPVVGLYLGRGAGIFVGGHKAVKECLASDVFNGRPEFMLHGMKERLGILFSDGDPWREQRRFSLWHLRDFGFGKIDLESTMHEEISDLLEEMQSEAEKNPANVLNVNGLFGVSIINVLWAMMAGNRFKHSDEELKKLLKVVEDIFRGGNVTGGALYNVVPLLKYIAPKMSGYEETRRRQSALRDFIQEQIAQHKETFDENAMRDFMDVYLNTLKKTEQPLHSSFTEDQLTAICIDMFMAGSETTSNFMAFSVLYMILYPDVQKKVQNELDEVIGKGRLPSLKDRPKLLYTEATLTEVFRMGNIAPFTVPHKTLEETEFMGYTIPKRTFTMVNLWSVHMDKEHWGDPETFRPERFLKEGKFVRDDWLVPFGIGKRSCVGESLARGTTFLFFTALMQKFNFSVPPGKDLPDSEPLNGFTLATKPFQARVVLRV